MRNGWGVVQREAASMGARDERNELQFADNLHTMNVQAFVNDGSNVSCSY